MISQSPQFPSYLEISLLSTSVVVKAQSDANHTSLDGMMEDDTPISNKLTNSIPLALANIGATLVLINIVTMTVLLFQKMR